MKPLLTAEDVAVLLALSPRTVTKLAAAGVIPGGRFGKSWRFDADDIADYRARQLRRPLAAVTPISSASAQRMAERGEYVPVFPDLPPLSVEQAR